MAETDEQHATGATRAAEPTDDPAPRRPTHRAAALAHCVALAGLAIYCLSAPASIAAAWIGISTAAVGWIARTLLTRDGGNGRDTNGSRGAGIVRRANLTRLGVDLPLWLFFAWTVLSCALSEEPRVSLPKIANSLSFLLAYLVAAVLRTRREAVALACLLVVGACAAVLWGVGELAVGRGVVVERIDDASPLRSSPGLRAGDCVWRVNDRRVSSVAEIDDAIRGAPVGSRIKLSLISRGEHVEREGAAVTDEWKSLPSPSGVAGTRASHRFRASGWTRHYETFAETVQIAAQLALGFALAHFLRRARRAHAPARRRRAFVFAAAFALLACGVALTAMRTSTVALACGALVAAWRAVGAAGERRAARRARVALACAVAALLALGALAVRRTRDAGALELQDPSARQRLQVARVYLSRVPLHPVFGHGMDAVHLHWADWGFPGTDMLHAHSTPLQLAFDRGLPAPALWLWLVLSFWLALARAERLSRDSEDPAAHGLLLGATAALSGFFLSSLVNYNFGDSEVALLVWWLLGTAARVRAGAKAGDDAAR
jgi:hypothetical protein